MKFQLLLARSHPHTKRCAFLVSTVSKSAPFALHAACAPLQVSFPKNTLMQVFPMLGCQSFRHEEKQPESRQEFHDKCCSCVKITVIIHY